VCVRERNAVQCRQPKAGGPKSVPENVWLCAYNRAKQRLMQHRRPLSPDHVLQSEHRDFENEGWFLAASFARSRAVKQIIDESDVPP
jgi:hypothetical protein